MLSIALLRRPLYCKKKFLIPICLLTMMCIAGVILGFIFGARPTFNPINSKNPTNITGKQMIMHYLKI